MEEESLFLDGQSPSTFSSVTTATTTTTTTTTKMYNLNEVQNRRDIYRDLQTIDTCTDCFPWVYLVPPAIAVPPAVGVGVGVPVGLLVLKHKGHDMHHINKKVHKKLNKPEDKHPTFGSIEENQVTLLSAGPRADKRTPLLIYFSNIELEEETHISSLAGKFKTTFLETEMETKSMLDNDNENDGFWLTFSDLKVDGYYDKNGVRHHGDRKSSETSEVNANMQNGALFNTENIFLDKKGLKRMEINKAYLFENEVLKTESKSILQKFNQITIATDEDEDDKNSVQLMATSSSGEQVDIGEYEIVDVSL